MNARSDAQKYAFGAIVTAIVVLLIFFGMSKAGIGGSMDSTTSTATGTMNK